MKASKGHETPDIKSGQWLVAWIKEPVPACGYCQSGQIMAAAAFLTQNPDPQDAEIVRALQGNLSRR